MKLNVEVIGMKAFKGVIDGQSLDSGTLFARIKLNPTRNSDTPSEVNWKVGECIEEWKLPTAAHVTRMKHIPLPFMCSLEVERMSNGRETKDVVTDCEPMSGSAQVRKVA